MPYYQFKCNQCQKELEVELAMSEVGQKKIKCPKCKKPMTRVFSFSVQTGGGSRTSSCSTGSCPFIK